MSQFSKFALLKGIADATAKAPKPVFVNLALPAHVFKFMEKEAKKIGFGDIARVVVEMYHQARIYREMVK